MAPYCVITTSVSSDLVRIYVGPVLHVVHCCISVLITPHWKVLLSSNLRHSVPLEMPFHMVSFFAKLKIFRFWPKTMDYNKAF